MTSPPKDVTAAREKARLDELKKALLEHNYRYYVLDDPSVSDEQYDAMLRELEAIERAHPNGSKRIPRVNGSEHRPSKSSAPSTTPNPCSASPTPSTNGRPENSTNASKGSSNVTNPSNTWSNRNSTAWPSNSYTPSACSRRD